MLAGVLALRDLISRFDLSPSDLMLSSTVAIK
jgi:hypothetical protein